MLYEWSIITTPLVRCTINKMLYHWMLIGIYTGESWNSTLMDSLKEQLKDKRMIYYKDQLELSTTVGQGRPYCSLCFLYNISPSFQESQG